MATPKKKKKVSKEAVQAATARYAPPTVVSSLPARMIPKEAASFPDALDRFDGFDIDATQQEFKSMERTLPTEQVPEIVRLQKLVSSLVGTHGFRDTPPEKVATWGRDSERYNYGGVFRPAQPDRIGMQAESLAALMRSPKYSPNWMEGVGVAANELAHYNQYLQMKGNLQHRNPETYDFNSRWAPPPEEAYSRNLSGRYDDSPFYFDKEHKPNGIRSDIEYQSTLIGDTVRQAYKTEQGLNQFREAAQTEQGQAAKQVLQNLAFDHFFGR